MRLHIPRTRLRLKSRRRHRQIINLAGQSALYNTQRRWNTRCWSWTGNSRLVEDNQDLIANASCFEFDTYWSQDIGPIHRLPAIPRPYIPTRFWRRSVCMNSIYKPYVIVIWVTEISEIPESVHFKLPVRVKVARVSKLFIILVHGLSSARKVMSHSLQYPIYFPKETLSVRLHWLSLDAILAWISTLVSLKKLSSTANSPLSSN